jgi:glycosyltransferase involved in cell wall biosynthesis
VSVALITTVLADYRLPLFERLARESGVEVLCVGGGERYVPTWFTDLDAQIARAPFPARRIDGPRGAFAAARHYDAVIAPFAGGAVLPAAYAGARTARRPFVLWASVWHEPQSRAHRLARPLIRRIYRDADAVVAYGPHVRRFVAGTRGRDDDVIVAPQAVEPELFGREVPAAEVARFRAEHELGDGPLVLYVGRLVAAKGIDVLLDAWRSAPAAATLVLIGDGELAGAAAGGGRVRRLAPLPRAALAPAYAAAEVFVLPSVPTPRFTEPWGLVVNEAMFQGTAVVTSDAVGAAAGGLVRAGETGLVVPAGDAAALGDALTRLLGDAALRVRLGAAGRQALDGYTYEAMAAAFERALTLAGAR